MKNLYLMITSLLVAFSCTQKMEDSLPEISEASLKKHLTTLASDEFLGRKPFTEGETKTLAYLKEQFDGYFR